MKLKQKNFLLFLGKAVSAIALSICQAIVSSALNSIPLDYLLCLKKILMLFILISQYRAYQAVNQLMLIKSTYEFKLGNSCSFNKDYKTGNQGYLTVNFSCIAPCAMDLA